ncbi:hypothetical protein CMV_001899 [Castanea mollissima]|uniref:Uncharacterized protein n=1 Tax=Castanea mollissima TaxID=60419 RepID=A0A8J4RZY0_9ROSI|nr:hypothetical protein CMV_001899 [Castanea mollissima]
MLQPSVDWQRFNIWCCEQVVAILILSVFGSYSTYLLEKDLPYVLTSALKMCTQNRLIVASKVERQVCMAKMARASGLVHRILRLLKPFSEGSGACAAANIIFYVLLS